ncbi:phosphatidate cytidylyltransferase, putative, partial [Plasmodium reichenowi]
NKICNDDKLNSFNILDILNTRQKDIDKQVK